MTNQAERVGHTAGPLKRLTETEWGPDIPSGTSGCTYIILGSSEDEIPLAIVMTDELAATPRLFAAANLFIAADGMLAALKSVCGALEYAIGNMDEGDVLIGKARLSLRIGRAAIAKAEGRTP